MSARLRVVAIVTVIAIIGAPAIADDPDPRKEATAHFEAGVALVDRGNDKAALVEFEQAYKIAGDWQYLFNIGVLQRKLFRYGEAITTFERYLSDGGAAVPAERRARVERELSELKNLVGDLSITIDGAPARIELDDAYVGDSPLPGPLVIAVGPHRVRATRDGADPAQQEITIVRGQRLELTLSPRARPTTARVTIATRPAHASLRIDDVVVTRSPWTGDLAKGGHRVVAEAPGYHPATEEVTVEAGQTRSFTLDLSRLPEHTPIYRRKAFWITLAAVCVAGGIAGIAYSQRPEEPDVQLHWP